MTTVQLRHGHIGKIWERKMIHRELISARFGEWNHVGSNFTSETSDGLLPGPGSNPGSLLPCCLQPGGRLRQGPYRGRGRVRSSCPKNECGPVLSRHPVLALLWRCRHGRRGPWARSGVPVGHRPDSRIRMRSRSRRHSRIHSFFVSAARQAAQVCWDLAPPSP